MRNRIVKSELVNWKIFEFLQPKNFKAMSEDTRQRLRTSLEREGFAQPFHVWDAGRLYCLDGYHRCLVLRELEAEGVEIPVLLPANFIDCEDRKEAARMVLIYTSRYAHLQQEGFEAFLQTYELDLSAIADSLHIPEINIGSISEPEKEFEEVDLPPAPREDRVLSTVIQQGDVFLLDSHIIVCGDSTNPSIATGMVPIAGVITSPPYARQRAGQYGGVNPDEYILWFDAIQSVIATVLSSDGSFFLNIKSHCEDGERHQYVHDLIAAMRNTWGWRFVEEYIWRHQGYPGDLPGRFKNQFEPIYHFSKVSASEIKFRPDNVLEPLSEAHHEKMTARKKGKAKETQKGFAHASGMGGMHYYGELEGARPGNVLHFNTGANNPHPASFPIGLPTFFIEAFSDRGDVWFEPFLGSGTTLLACEMTGRFCRGVDAMPEYVEMAIARWAYLRRKLGKDIEFRHENGNLTLEDIINSYEENYGEKGNPAAGEAELAGVPATAV